ncbi:MAG: GcrA family cell cycle regulator [Beijerinckiaceae bacterium]
MDGSKSSSGDVMGIWNETIIERLKEHHLSGKYSNSLLAERLNREFGTNLTRNSVIGKIHRLGLAMPRIKAIQSDFYKIKKTREAPRKKSIGVLFPASQKSFPQDEAKAMRESIFKSADLSKPSVRTTVETVSHGQCRYIYGHPGIDADWTFCGRTHVPGQSYCAGHLCVTRTSRYTLQEKPVTERQLECV